MQNVNWVIRYTCIPKLFSEVRTEQQQFYAVKIYWKLNKLFQFSLTSLTCLLILTFPIFTVLAQKLFAQNDAEKLDPNKIVLLLLFCYIFMMKMHNIIMFVRMNSMM